MKEHAVTFCLMSD